MVAQNQAITLQAPEVNKPLALGQAEALGMSHAHAAAALLYVEKAMKSLVEKASELKPLHKPTDSQPILPPLSPQLRKDLLAYLEAMEMLQQARAKLKEMAKELSHMKNVMYGVVEIMNQFQNIEGAKVSAFSSLDNVDSDVRSEITGAQGQVNAMSGGKATPAEAKKLVDFIKSLDAFVDRMGGNSKIIGKGTLKSLTDAINNVKKVFGKDWGNPTAMAKEMNTWTAEAKKGKFSPQLKDLQFGLQQANQTVSALSTSTNTQLEFVTNMFKEFLGVDESGMQAYQKGNLTMIQNQRSN